MQDGRNADELAHALETLAAVFGGVKVHQTCLGSGLRGAAGDDDDDVVFQELFHQLDVRGIGADLGVVAADHGDRAAQNAGLHNIDQRSHRAGDVHMGVRNAVQTLLDGLDGVAHARLGLELRDVDKILIAVFEVLDRHPHDRLGVFSRGVLVELDEIGVRHPGDGGGGDELGVEAFGERTERREDALHVHNDRLASAGEHDVFLLEEVARHGDALTHGDFVAGAADAADVDALCAVFLGERDELGVLRIEHDHFRQRRIVTVDNDVDHVLFHNADVRGGVNGLRRAEQHVGELCAHHRAAPAVGQTGAQRLLDERFGQRGAAHMRHMHGLRDLAVDGARLDAGFVPQLLRMLRRALEIALHAEGLAVFHQTRFGDLVRQIVQVLALGLDAPFGSDPLELFGVFDLIRAAFFCLVERMADLAAVVRVRCRAARGEAQVVTADDAVYVAAADAARRLGRDAARTHRADTAASAGFAESAVRGLVLDALLPGVRADLPAGFQQGVRRFLHLFNRD